MGNMWKYEGPPWTNLPTCDVAWFIVVSRPACAWLFRSYVEVEHSVFAHSLVKGMLSRQPLAFNLHRCCTQSFPTLQPKVFHCVHQIESLSTINKGWQNVINMNKCIQPDNARDPEWILPLFWHTHSSLRSALPSAHAVPLWPLDGDRRLRTWRGNKCGNSCPVLRSY